MDTEVYITGAVAALFAGLTVLSSWQAARPWNSVKTRMVPWRALFVIAGAITLIVLAYLASQLTSR